MAFAAAGIVNVTCCHRCDRQISSFFRLTANLSIDAMRLEYQRHHQTSMVNSSNVELILT